MALRIFLTSGSIAERLREIDRLLRTGKNKDRDAALALARDTVADAQSLPRRDSVRREALLRMSFVLRETNGPEAFDVLSELMLDTVRGDDADTLDASTFNNMAVLLDQRGEYAAAIRKFRVALDIKRRLLGTDSMELVPLLLDMLRSADSLNDPDLELELAEEMHRIMSCHLDTDDPNMVPVIANLRVARDSTRRASRKRAETDAEQNPGGDDTPTEDDADGPPFGDEAETAAVIAAFEGGQFEHAQALHFNWLEKRTHSHSGGNFFAGFMHDFFDPILAWAVQQDGLSQEAVAREDFEAAIGYFRQVEAVMGCYPSRPDRLAAAKSNLARTLIRVQRFDTARALSTEALTLVEAFEDDFPARKGILGNHAELYMAIADFEAPDPQKAMPTLDGRPEDFQVRLRIRIPLRIENESPISAAARQLDARAASYGSLSEFDRERRLLELASELWRREAKGRAAVLLPSLLALLRHHQRHGRPDRAEPILEEASAFPADDIDPRDWVSLRLHSLELAVSLNRRHAAVGVIGELLGFAERPGLDPILRRAARENAAVGFCRLGAQDAARPILLEILEEAGDCADASAATLAQLAQFATAVDDHEKAKAWLERAMEMWRAETGEWTPAYAVALSNAATLARHRGDWQASIERHQQALRIRTELFGPHHPQVLASSLRLIFCLGATGEHGRALDIALGALEAASSILGRASAMSSEDEFLLTIEHHSYVLGIALSLVGDPATGRCDEVLTALLRQKGRAAYGLLARRKAVLADRYPGLERRLDELHELQSLIAAATLSGSESPQTLAEATRRRADLETELARAIPEMAIDVQLSGATSAAVQEALEPDELLVEVVRFKKIDWDRTRADPGSDEAQEEWRYAAFVLGRHSQPQFLDLGPASILDADMARAVAHFGDRADDQGAIARLSACLVEPILAAARRSGARLVYFAPDGETCLLPLDALPADDGKPLLEHLEVVHLAAGRDLLRPPPAGETPPTPPMILAAPDYDADYRREPSVDTSSDGKAQVRAMRFRAHFKPLPGTAREGEALHALFPSGRLVTGEAARRSALEQISRPLFLHLATHGYFLNGGGGDVMSIDPMLRSGLALAGANLASRTGDAELYGEGLLTAASVATLDLFDTDLVTLSACESGVGETRGGEGVFGLRRAFATAGARTVVMSLWKVGDLATADLMELFYRGLADGLGKSEALRKAKQELRGKGAPANDWGAFIIEGDVSPLRQPS